MTTKLTATNHANVAISHDVGPNKLMTIVVIEKSRNQNGREQEVRRRGDRGPGSDRPSRFHAGDREDDTSD